MLARCQRSRYTRCGVSLRPSTNPGGSAGCPPTAESAESSALTNLWPTRASCTSKALQLTGGRPERHTGCAETLSSSHLCSQGFAASVLFLLILALVGFSFRFAQTMATRRAPQHMQLLIGDLGVITIETTPARAQDAIRYFHGLIPPSPITPRTRSKSRGPQSRSRVRSRRAVRKPRTRTWPRFHTDTSRARLRNSDHRRFSLLSVAHPQSTPVSAPVKEKL